MINHIRTLLMNVSAGSMPPGAWPVDPSYVSVSAGKEAESLRSELFLGADTPSDRAFVVDSVMPFVMDPEMAWFFGRYDRRSTVPFDLPSGRSGKSTAWRFQRSMRGDVLSPVVARCLASPSASTVFSLTGDAYADETIGRLRPVFYSGFEPTRRFSAALHALVARTDLARRASIGRL